MWLSRSLFVRYKRTITSPDTLYVFDCNKLLLCLRFVKTGYCPLGLSGFRIETLNIDRWKHAPHALIYCLKAHSHSAKRRRFQIGLNVRRQRSKTIFSNYECAFKCYAYILLNLNKILTSWWGWSGPISIPPQRRQTLSIDLRAPPMNHFHGNNWRIQGDSRNAHPPRYHFFNFHAVFDKTLSNNRFSAETQGFVPLGNPESTTGNYNTSVLIHLQKSGLFPCWPWFCCK